MSDAAVEAKAADSGENNVANAGGSTSVEVGPSSNPEDWERVLKRNYKIRYLVLILSSMFMVSHFFFFWYFPFSCLPFLKRLLG